MWCEIKNILVGIGFVYFSNGMLDSFKIEGWLWDEKWKIWGLG